MAEKWVPLEELSAISRVTMPRVESFLRVMRARKQLESRVRESNGFWEFKFHPDWGIALQGEAVCRDDSRNGAPDQRDESQTTPSALSQDSNQLAPERGNDLMGHCGPFVDPLDADSPVARQEADRASGLTAHTDATTRGYDHCHAPCPFVPVAAALGTERELDDHNGPDAERARENDCDNHARAGSSDGANEADRHVTAATQSSRANDCRKVGQCADKRRKLDRGGGNASESTPKARTVDDFLDQRGVNGWIGCRQTCAVPLCTRTTSTLPCTSTCACLYICTYTRMPPSTNSLM